MLNKFKFVKKHMSRISKKVYLHDKTLKIALGRTVEIEYEFTFYIYIYNMDIFYKSIFKNTCSYISTVISNIFLFIHE